MSGSFDPITRGHEYIIKRASELFDEVIILLAYNPFKTSYLNIVVRQAVIQDFLNSEETLGNVVIDFLQVNDLVVNYAVAHDVKYIVRGLRNATDLEYESGINAVQKDIDPTVETIFFPTPEHLVKVSSSMIKSLVGKANWEQIVSKYVSAPVLHALRKKHADQEAR